MEYSKDENINVKISSLAAKTNENVNVCLEISEDIGFINEANILIGMKNNKNEKTIQLKYLWTQNQMNYFTCNINLEYAGLYYFIFKLRINGEEKYIQLDNMSQKPVISNETTNYWTMTIYDKDFEVPNWAKGRIMYHIFVDRFYRSNKYNPKEMQNRIIKKWGETPDWKLDFNAKYNNIDFFMGNLKGIEEKIPYLRNLGVEILYLSPVCRSQSNHRYDVCNYEMVDPYLGSNADLKNLCIKAHKNGMKIIVDGVFNHTGNDSIYFNEYGNYDSIGAFQSKESKYYEWYRKNENGNFEYWWGFKNLPVCDGRNKEWQNFIYGKNGIIEKWFKLGIDGIRLDVADELTDEFIENIRNTAKACKKDSFIIGEVWENAITKEKDGIQRKYLLGKGLDTVMNYPFTNAILKYIRFGDYNFFKYTLNDILNKYPKDSVFSLMNSLSTHDITRAITTLSGKGIDEKQELIWDTEYDRERQLENEKLSSKELTEGIKRFKLATIIQYFLPGNACIYYGDEIGMYSYKDPFNRRCFEWSKEGNELNQFFIKLGKIKKTYTFVYESNFEILTANEKILIFRRFNDDEALTIIINRTNEIIKNPLENYQNKNLVLHECFTQNSIGKYGFAIMVDKNKNNIIKK